MCSVGEMGVRRLSRYPHGSVWVPPRQELKAGVGGAVYIVGGHGVQRGPAGMLWGPSAAAGRGEEQPLSLPTIHFGSRVMEWPGHAGPFQRLWRVFTAAAQVSYPLGFVQGTPTRDQGQKTRSVRQHMGTASLPAHRGPCNAWGSYQEL